MFKKTDTVTAKMCMAATFFLYLLYIATAVAGDPVGPPYPSHITLRAAKIPGETFGAFQRDLLQRLELFALDDNVTLSFQTTDVQELYSDNLAMIAPECLPNTTVEIQNITYSCNDYDMIVGDFWTTPTRYNRVDFTPPWLQTSISAMKFIEKTKRPQFDVTTLKEAAVAGAPVCIMEKSFIADLVAEAYPSVVVVPCIGSDEVDGCSKKLKDEECSLWLSDELVLRKRQAADPALEMTGERWKRQLLAWPVRRSLDPTVAFLLNKWIYAAISNQTIDRLYFEYFEKKLCPIGTAGKDCELPCDADHGMANARGVCICESTLWTGDDCSVEVPVYLHLIPTPLKAIAFCMLGFNIMAIIACGVWLYKHWKSEEVQASQPLFLFLVLLGCLISSSTIVALAQEDDADGPVPACMAIPWLYSVGFCVTFGTLFGKIRRVYNIFHKEYATRGTSIRANRSLRSSFSSGGRNPVAVHYTLLCIGGVLLLDVIILVLWTAVDPLEWQRTIMQEDQFGEPMESEGHCSSEFWKVFAGIIVAYHIGLLAIACYMCYIARDIPTKYSEHKYLSLAMVSNLQIFVIGVPILVLLSGDPETSFFIRVLIVWMNDLSVIVLIFGNLMYTVHFSPISNSHERTDGDKIQTGIAVLHYTAHCGPTDIVSRSRKGGQQVDEVLSYASEITLPNFQPSSLSSPSLALHPMPPREFLSSLSGKSMASRKSVSFSDCVFVSEYDGAEAPEGDAEQELSSVDRFLSEPIQGPPFKPGRPSAHDGAMAQPMRQSSTFEITSGPSDTMWSIIPPKNKPQPARRSSFNSHPTRSARLMSQEDPDATLAPPSFSRGLSLDSRMIQPIRNPSDNLDESESSVVDIPEPTFTRAKSLDFLMIQPTRKASQFLDVSESSCDEVPEPTFRRESSADNQMVKPTRKPSEFLDESDSSCDSYLEGTLHGAQPLDHPMIQPVRQGSKCNFGDAVELPLVSARSLDSKIMHPTQPPVQSSAGICSNLKELIQVPPKKPQRPPSPLQGTGEEGASIKSVYSSESARSPNSAMRMPERTGSPEPLHLCPCDGQPVYPSTMASQSLQQVRGSESRQSNSTQETPGLYERCSPTNSKNESGELQFMCIPSSQVMGKKVMNGTVHEETDKTMDESSATTIGY